MNSFITKTLAATIASTFGACGLTAPAVAQQLVNDGGFDVGSNGLTGWTVSGAPVTVYNGPLYDPGVGFVLAPTPPDSDNSNFALFKGTTLATLSQTFAGTPGDVGTFSVFFADADSAPAQLTINWDGNQIFNTTQVIDTQSLPFQYGQIVIPGLSLSANNTLTISGSSAGFGVAIADVSFQDTGKGITTPGVPEPAAWTLMLIGFGGLGASMRFHRARAVALA